MNSEKFHYKFLNEILYNLYLEGIKSVSICLLISLEKEYYEGDFLKNIIKDLRKITENNILYLDYHGVKTNFKISKIQIEVGDILNRHIWYYRYCEEYMLKNNISDEMGIPENIREEFIKKSYITGKKQGEDWFKNNVEAINQLIPNNCRLNKEFELNNGVTLLFKGNNSYPKLEYVCYEYWLNHPKYKEKEKNLFEVCSIEDSIVERAYNHEAQYFYERLSNRKKIYFKDLFVKQSKKYLFDETVPTIIRYIEKPNILEFYFGGRENNHTKVFRGKKAQNNQVIKQYLNTCLKGIEKRKFITIQN